jgi:nitroreductase/NAD-dependent dihydropyrimidine dehydrogenase PreA subunit
MEIIRIDEDKCTLCGLCIPVCVRRILQEGEGAVKITDQSRCILCGHCIAVCPENAPQLPSLDAEEFEPAPRPADLPSPEQLMTFFRSRRSVRIFRADPVERAKLDMVIQAGRYAPTGGNRQPLHYVVVRTPEKLRAIRTQAINALLAQGARIEKAFKASREHGEPVPEKYQNRDVYVGLWRDMSELLQKGIDRLFFNAPALIVCHVDLAASVTPIADAGLAAMQMALMVHALGLGSCFCGFLVFAMEESPDLREALGVPHNHSAPLSFMVGYPDVHFLKLVSRNPARVSWL